MPTHRFLNAVEVWAWQKIGQVHDDNTRRDLVRYMEGIVAGDIDEEHWGESAAAVESQEQLGASTPTMGFIE